MDRLFYLFHVLLETIGMAPFMVGAVFALLIGFVYQTFFKRRAKVRAPEPVTPPVTPKVEKEAEAAKEGAGMKPADTTLGYFNDLAKP